MFSNRNWGLIDRSNLRLQKSCYRGVTWPEAYGNAKKEMSRQSKMPGSTHSIFQIMKNSFSCMYLTLHCRSVVLNFFLMLSLSNSLDVFKRILKNIAAHLGNLMKDCYQVFAERIVKKIAIQIFSCFIDGILCGISDQLHIWQY